MRCKHCDYPLWNLRSRICPECGTGFVPSEFRFALNTVRFCCPHCDQEYYGTGADGHLVPRLFDCIRCTRRIEMDEMVLLPTEGVDERLTKGETNPWLDPGRPLLSRWGATLYRGACTPHWLLRVTPVTSGAGRAWAFAIFSLLGVGLVVLVPLMLLTIAAAGGGIGGLGGSLIFMLIGSGVGTCLWLGLWVLIAHGVLRLRGPTEGGIGRTAQAICYTCAPQLVTLVPCLGLYFGWVGTLWWVIVAGFALAAAQKVGGVRAAVAVLVLPVISAMLMVGTIALAVVGANSGYATYATGQGVSPFLQPLRDAAAQGAWPAHAAQLLVDHKIVASDFRAVMSGTVTADCLVDTTTLAVWDGISPAAQQGMVDRAAAAMPAGVVAHRVGDFVFTYHGIDPTAPDPDLWLVVEAWDPVVGGEQFLIHSLTAGGEVQSFPTGALGVNLRRQNALRASLGLAPLPDPSSVLAGQPVAADPPPAAPTTPDDPG